MFNLPLDSTINNCGVFHEGNHDDRGFIHNQYVSKPRKYHVSATCINEFYEIIQIRQTKQVDCFYEFILIDMINDIEKKLKFTINNNILKMNTDYPDCFGEFYFVKKEEIISIYFKPIKISSIYFDTTICVSRYWDDFYAYNCLTLINNTSPINSIELNNKANISYSLKKIELETTQIASNAYSMILIKDNNIKKESFINIRPLYGLQSGLCYSIANNNVDGECSLCIVNNRNDDVTPTRYWLIEIINDYYTSINREIS